jgi:hypothetical protein
MPVPPYLNETWAATYFEVTAAILIFGVGIPALFIQALVPEDIRDVVYHHHKGLRWSLYFVLIFAVCALGFVWVAHPNSTNSPLPANQTLPSAGPLAIQPGSLFVDWLSAGIMTFVILAMVFLFHLQSFYSRERLLKYLEEKCKKNIARYGTLDENILRDLQTLGEHSKSETDRRKALRVLKRLARRVQKRRRYSGNNLEPIFSAMRVTLRGGNSDTYTETARVLQRIMEQLQNSNHNNKPDMLAALKELQRVGELALELESEIAALTILDIITLVGQDANGVPRETGRILFELGVKAMKQQRYLFVVAVLNRLETMANQEAAALVNYLGLIAHFAEAGASAQRRAQVSLESVDFQPSLRACLQAAKEHHAALAHFETANKLEAILTKPDTLTFTTKEEN